MEILNYLFSLRPGSQFSYYMPLLILALATFAFSIGLRIFIKKAKDNRALKKLFSGLPSKLQWFSFVLLFLIANRHENIPYFSMRVWLYLALGVFIYLAGKNIYLAVKKYPEEKSFYLRRQNEQTENKKVYTAKKKKK